MGVLGPVTRLSNKTDDEMVVTMVNALGRVEGKRVIIPAKGYRDLGYRKGIGRIGGKVTFRVEPTSRSGVPGKEILPFKVFEHAGIDIVYKLADENGPSIDFKFDKDTLFRRIWLVRWLRGVYASASAFGNCCFASSGCEEASVSAPPQAVHAAIAAPLQTTPPQAILAPHI